MASSDFSIPQELNPGVDRAPAAPAVTRRIYIPPSNGTSFVQNGDLQFRLPTAEPGSMLDARYTYLKFNVEVTFEQVEALSINHTWQWPAGGANSLFERLEVYQGGVPVEQIGHYNIIAKKFFQEEAGMVDMPDYHAGTMESMHYEETTATDQPANIRALNPSGKFQQMTGHLYAFENVASELGSSTVNFQFCIPILSGLVGLWSEKFLPLMLLGLSSFYLNFKLADIASILEPIWSSAVAAGFGADEGVLGNQGVARSGVVGAFPDTTATGTQTMPAVGGTITAPWFAVTSESYQNVSGSQGLISGFKMSNIELVCTQVLLLPSVTQLIYNNANQNSISWTTTSRRDYPQILADDAGGWTIDTSAAIGDPVLTVGGTTSLDLIVPCRLQSVRSFDLIMTYIGTTNWAANVPTANFLRGYHQQGRLFFLNPVYTSLQFKKGSEYFPQRPMGTEVPLNTWIAGTAPELTAESLIGQDDWLEFGTKCGTRFMTGPFFSQGISPGIVHLGNYSYTQDCRAFRGVDSSTRSGISFEKEQFNIVMDIAPVGGDGTVTMAADASDTPLDMGQWRFHVIPVYDMMVTITPTGSMEVAY